MGWLLLYENLKANVNVIGKSAAFISSRLYSIPNGLRQLITPLACTLLPLSTFITKPVLAIRSAYFTARLLLAVTTGEVVPLPVLPSTWLRVAYTNSVPVTSVVEMLEGRLALDTLYPDAKLIVRAALPSANYEIVNRPASTGVPLD